MRERRHAPIGIYQEAALLADNETITGNWTFTGTGTVSAKWEFSEGIGATKGIDGRYTDLSGSASFGATIWTLDSSWTGTGSGDTYNPTNIYGISWLRNTNTAINSNVGEGLYIYQNGSEMAAIGQYASSFKTVLPKTSETYNLGASTARWDDAFIHGLWLYDSTAADSINMFHNGSDLRINCTGTRWWSIRGADVLQLDADSAGSSPIPPLTSHTLNHCISVTSTTSGDALGFIMYNVDGTNNPRAGFFLDDTNAQWGHSMTWSSGAPMDYGIWIGGTQYFGVDYTNTDTGRTCVASALDHSGNLRQLGFNDLKRQRSDNISFSMGAQDAGSSQYYTTTGNTITTEANTSQDFPIGAVLTVINRSSGTQTVAAGTGVTIYKLIGSSSSGSATIGAYSVAWIYRYDASTFFVWGFSVT